MINKKTFNFTVGKLMPEMVSVIVKLIIGPESFRDV